MAERANIPYTSYGDDIRKSSAVRWGLASFAAGALGAAFIPAALMGGGDWATVVENVAPLWSVCCLIGMACGLRGMYLARRRATVRQRTIAAAGAILSLVTFIVMTTIALIGGQ